MAWCTANGLPVSEATITVARVGNWHADLLVVEADAAKLDGAVTIALAEGGMSFKGTAQRGGSYKAATGIRVVGGGGGLPGQLAAKAYLNTSINVVLQDICREAGEQLSAQCDQATLAVVMDRWTRAASPASGQLRELANTLDVTWRILPDGTLWFGTERWDEARISYEKVHDEPQLGAWTIASTSPTVYPGQTLEGRRVSFVEHRITPSGIRSQVWFQDGAAGAEHDRITAAIKAMIDVHVGSRLPYFAHYPAKVISQNADGTLELQPDDPTIGAHSKVPLHLPVPGATLKVAAGSRVTLSFGGGDPRHPRATIWELGTLSQLILACADIQLGASGGEPATLGQTLATFLGTTLKTWLDTHTHPTGVGPSSVPTVLSPSMPTITASKVKVT